jgi:hypothetical protein
MVEEVLSFAFPSRKIIKSEFDDFGSLVYLFGEWRNDFCAHALDSRDLRTCEG